MKPKFVILLILVYSNCISQNVETNNFINEIKEYNISNIWTIDKLVEYGTTSPIIKKAEPLGFIGDSYQRFYIHFISVIKNPENKLEYLIYGKTKVKKNICDFQGKIIINTSFLYKNQDIIGVKLGVVEGYYVFFEDLGHKGSGKLKGKFKSYFFIDKNNNINYDYIYFGADGYRNNQFEGSWKSYKNNVEKTCNWGDYRIPNSKKLDMGCGEFSINKKYLKNGWENYVNAYFESNDSVAKKARKIENEKWWQKNQLSNNKK